MKVRVSEAEREVLDRAVALASGWAKSQLRHLMKHPVKFSSDWAYGGPIIEREGISIYPDESEDLPDIKWSADSQNTFRWGGPTPLIAAMRCYVASKLGDEVDVPDELAPKK